MEEIRALLNNIGKEHHNQVNILISDVSGGKMTEEKIDQLSEIYDKPVLTISGLQQKTFEYLILKYGKRFKAINFWKCPLVCDLAPIESLSEVEYITYFWNQRAEKLWNFKKTPKIKGLCIDDFTRLHSLIDLENAQNLIELEFGDKVWVKLILDTLDPLSMLKKLERLRFSAKKISDNRINPLSQLLSIKKLHFPSGLFTTQQIAWLKTKLPVDIDSIVLNPYWTIEKPIEMNGKSKNTFIVGKGKPFLDAVIDKKKIEKYVNEFNSYIEMFTNNPGLEPEKFA